MTNAPNAVSPTMDSEAERSLLEVLRQLNMAVALVADARDRGQPMAALGARFYLRAAADELVKIGGRSNIENLG